MITEKSSLRRHIYNVTFSSHSRQLSSALSSDYELLKSVLKKYRPRSDFALMRQIRLPLSKEFCVCVCFVMHFKRLIESNICDQSKLKSINSLKKMIRWSAPQSLASYHSVSSCLVSIIIRMSIMLELPLTSSLRKITVNSLFFREFSKYLRAEFDFWNVYGIMNTSGLLQSK